MFGFCWEFWVVARGNFAFFSTNVWRICGEFVVLVWFLLVGNGDDEDWSECAQWSSLE
jgi:hypothetical protein